MAESIGPFFLVDTNIMAKVLSPADEIRAIRNKMGHFSLEARPKSWLDTGSRRLNRVLGTKLGIPWGRIIELFGPESNGKSVLAMELMAIAQAAGAWVIWHDAENSVILRWLRKRGINTDEMFLIQPYEGFFGKKPKYDKKGRLLNDPELATAEILCDEVRELIKKLHRKEPDRPIFYVLDSITALETAYEMQVGMKDANMKSNTELSRFLSRLMKQWVGLFQTHNVTGVFINQLRTKPGVSFGNPEYTTGGKAVKFYAHVRARIGRVGSGGRLLNHGEQIGIKGIIKCIKSKVGGVEGRSCGYKIWYNGQAKFMDAAIIKQKGEADD